MKCFRKICKVLTFVMIATMVLCLSIGHTLYADEPKQDASHFNVVVVLDASNSMNYTDPNGYRNDAIGLFINLLSEKGNYIGNVVFSDDILSKQDVAVADGQDIKDQFLDKLKGTQAMGYTNIGAALDEAVRMIDSKGNPDMPSVILFLSDGNTEMPTESATNISLEVKADALQNAREHKIPIYSVCLNDNNKADVSEMEQLAVSTGGSFFEVNSPEDLVDVFNEFYNLIYGTYTIEIGDETIPQNGKVEKEFTLPSFGVEEVNIVVYGMIDDVVVTDPSGGIVDSTSRKTSAYTFVKFSDVKEGVWKLTAIGNPDTQIKINMIYNSDLHVKLSVSPDEKSFHNTDELTFEAVMTSGNRVASEDANYVGFDASLIVMNNVREVIDEIPMEVSGGRFVTTKTFDNGTYYFKVKVNGNSLNRESEEELGPVTVSDEPIPENSAPVPIKNPVQDTVYVIPFKNTTYKLDLTTLAKDAEDSELHYEIQSSSFVEGKEYNVESEQLTVMHFGLRKAAFTVRAYDSLGEYCDIEVIIRSINVGILTLILIALAALVVLIIFGISIYNLALIPFRGTINVVTFNNGNERKEAKVGGHGNIPLHKFAVDTFDLKKSTRLQATAKNYIKFIIKPGLFDYSGQRVTYFEVSEQPVTLYVSPNNRNQYITVVFFPEVKKGSGVSNSMYGGHDDGGYADAYSSGESMGGFGSNGLYGGNMQNDYVNNDPYNNIGGRQSNPQGYFGGYGNQDAQDNDSNKGTMNDTGNNDTDDQSPDSQYSDYTGGSSAGGTNSNNGNPLGGYGGGYGGSSDNSGYGGGYGGSSDNSGYGGGYGGSSDNSGYGGGYGGSSDNSGYGGVYGGSSDNNGYGD